MILNGWISRLVLAVGKRFGVSQRDRDVNPIDVGFLSEIQLQFIIARAKLYEDSGELTGGMRRMRDRASAELTRRGLPQSA